MNLPQPDSGPDSNINSPYCAVHPDTFFCVPNLLVYSVCWPSVYLADGRGDIHIWYGCQSFSKNFAEKGGGG
jgi:hypothetical protein